MPVPFYRRKLLILGIFLYSLFCSSLGQSTEPKVLSDTRTYPGCLETSCQMPNCRCPSPNTPGGLSPSQIPQFIVVTHDDAITSGKALMENLLEGYTNPNSCPAPGTYYVSGQQTDYHKVQQLYAAGNEIAVHTFTHTTSASTSIEQFEDEILGMRRALSLYARIPEDQIRGFRAPFLASNNMAMRILWSNNFTYDSSIPEVPLAAYSTSTGNMIWPYTMDKGIAQSCWVSKCTDEKFPGLWQFPLYTVQDESDQYVSDMDPKTNTGEVYSLLKRNFDMHRSGNRAPFGIFTHSPYLASPSTMAQLRMFLEYANQFDDVYFATTSQVLDWMKTPVPLSAMASSPLFSCAPRFNFQKEVCDGQDDDGDGVIDNGLVTTCSYTTPGMFSFDTCAKTCPQLYPFLGTVDYLAPPPKVCNGLVIDQQEVCGAELDENSSQSGSSEDGSSDDLQTDSAVQLMVYLGLVVSVLLFIL